MVDFQSRDTSRGLGTDTDDDEDEETEEEGANEVAEATVDTEPADEGAADSGATGMEAAGTADDSPGPGDAAAGTAHDQANEPAHEADQEHDDAQPHPHHHHGHPESVGVAVVTISSTRELDDDPSGDSIVSILEATPHELAQRDLVRDDHDGIQSTVMALVEREDVDAVITTGGTGITPDDVTVEAVEPLFDKRLPGFGELFRRRSQQEIGTRAMATRATAGVVDGALVFCLPGSEAAARLGTDALVTEELSHLVGLARDDTE